MTEENARAAGESVCGAFRSAFRELGKAMAPPEKVEQHFREARKQVLMGLREMIDHRIEKMIADGKQRHTSAGGLARCTHSDEDGSSSALSSSIFTFLDGQKTLDTTLHLMVYYCHDPAHRCAHSHLASLAASDYRTTVRRSGAVYRYRETIRHGAECSD